MSKDSYSPELIGVTAQYRARMTHGDLISSGSSTLAASAVSGSAESGSAETRRSQPERPSERKPGSTAQGIKPNVLLVLTDNTGWGDWGAYGGGKLRGAPSPRVDELASEGMRLLNFNTEPQCTPSRAALLTGRHAIRTGAQEVPIGTRLYGLVPWEATLAEILADEGYATACFGKWHLGRTQGRWPTDKGFDEWYGIPNSTDEAVWVSPGVLTSHSILADVDVPDADRPYLMEGRKGSAPWKVKLYDHDERRIIDAELVRRTIEFMKRSKEEGKLFFAYVPLTATHYPTLPHPDFIGKSGHGDYADMLVQTDNYLGRMLDALDQLALADDTLVIFTSDNGAEDPAFSDGEYSGWTGPWAGSYFTAMEGGLRAPFIIRWPGRVPAGHVNNEIVHLVDIFATVAAIAGARVPDDRPIDGINMSEFFLGRRDRSDREGFVIFVGNDLRAVKWRDWKMHYAWQETKQSPIQRYSTVPKIVDLTRDPRETRNVAEPHNSWLQYPMVKLVLDFQASVQQHPNVPVGAPDSYRP